MKKKKIFQHYRLELLLFGLFTFSSVTWEGKSYRKPNIREGCCLWNFLSVSSFGYTRVADVFNFFLGDDFQKGSWEMLKNVKNNHRTNLTRYVDEKLLFSFDENRQQSS